MSEMSRTIDVAGRLLAAVLGLALIALAVGIAYVLWMWLPWWVAVFIIGPVLVLGAAYFGGSFILAAVAPRD